MSHSNQLKISQAQSIHPKLECKTVCKIYNFTKLRNVYTLSKHNYAKDCYPQMNWLNLKSCTLSSGMRNEVKQGGLIMPSLPTVFYNKDHRIFKQ